MGRRGLGLLIVLLILGGLIGSLLGLALDKVWPVLNHNFPSIGFAPVTIDLSVAEFTIGLTIDLNVASIIGFLVALFLYYKL